MIASYISANQFSVSGDHSVEFVTGRRIKVDCGVDGLLYSTVQSSYYSDPITIVTVKDLILTINMVSVLYGIIHPGDDGSLPDHIHSGDSGQGGVLNFLSLSDVPTTYSGSIGKYLVVSEDGIAFSESVLSSGINSNISNYEYKSASFVAEVGGRYQCDTSAGSFTTTTPENPFAMDEFTIADATGSFATNNLLVSGTQNIRGISDTLAIDVNWATVNMVYINESIGWRY